jgi:hypothetical protein
MIHAVNSDYLMMMFFWVKRSVDWLVEANVSEKRTVSIFRVEDRDR